MAYSVALSADVSVSSSLVGDSSAPITQEHCVGVYPVLICALGACVLDSRPAVRVVGVLLLFEECSHALGGSMTLQNYIKHKPGERTEVYGVTTNNGNKVTPNAHTWRRLKCSYDLNRNTQWRGVGGEMRESVTDHNLASCGPVPHSMLAWLEQKGQVTEFPESAMQEKLMGRMYDKLRGNNEVVVDLAEAGSTITMLKAVKSLRGSMVDFAKDVIWSVNSNKANAKGTSKHRQKVAAEAAGRWLEYRYGWTPLAHTVFDAADNLVKKVHEEPFVLKSRTHYGRERSFYHRSGSATIGDLITMTGKASASYRMELGLRFSPPVSPLQRIANWTSLNPALIAWELVPLSFVADWFVNVGDYLRDFENNWLYGTNFLGGYRTVTARETRSANFFRGSPRPSPLYWPNGELKDLFYGSQDAFSGFGQWDVLTRTKVTQLPRAAEFKFSVNLNAKRVADSIALTSKWWRRIL